MATQTPRKNKAEEVFLHPDARNGILWKASCTLGTTSQVSTFNLPDDAIGFRLRPTTTDVYFAISENPTSLTAVAYSGSAITVSSSFGAGGVAKADAWEVRLLEPFGKTGVATTRTLRLLPATSSSVCVIEVF